MSANYRDVAPMIPPGYLDAPRRPVKASDGGHCELCWRSAMAGDILCWECAVWRAGAAMRPAGGPDLARRRAAEIGQRSLEQLIKRQATK